MNEAKQQKKMEQQSKVVDVARWSSDQPVYEEKMDDVEVGVVRAETQTEDTWGDDSGGEMFREEFGEYAWDDVNNIELPSRRCGRRGRRRWST